MSIVSMPEQASEAMERVMLHETMPAAGETPTPGNGSDKVKTRSISDYIGPLITLGIFVAAEEVDGVQEITLYPNPTSGRAFVDVKLLKNMDVQMRLLNLSGQVVFQSQQENATSFNQEIDLSGQAPGMYILQVIADGKPYHAKLMVAR